MPEEEQKIIQFPSPPTNQPTEEPGGEPAEGKIIPFPEADQQADTARKTSQTLNAARQKLQQILIKLSTQSND